MIKTKDRKNQEPRREGSGKPMGAKWEKKPEDRKMNMKSDRVHKFDKGKEVGGTAQPKSYGVKDQRGTTEGMPRREGSGKPMGAKWEKKPEDRRMNMKPDRVHKFDKGNEVRETAQMKGYGVKEERDTTEDIPRLEGRNPVLEALKSGRTIEKILVAKGSQEGSIRQIISMAREKGIVIVEVDRVKLDAMSEIRSHQGVIAMVSPYSYVEIEEMLKDAQEKNEKPFIIVLDEIYDPHNLGSILRTADACGAHGVVITKRRAVGLTPTVAKASAGAVEYVKVAKVTNITQTIKYLKQQGLWIVGADMDGKKAYFEAELTGAIALVIGNEGEGIGKLVKENCDFLVRLPMKGQIASLNAGVASAVLMYEIVRQRILSE